MSSTNWLPRVICLWKMS